MSQYFRILVEVALSLVIMSLSGMASIQLPGLALPLTLQSMCAILLPLIFERRNAAGGILLFLVLALLGLPVLSGGASGVDHFLGMSGGYLVGFYIIAQVSGFLKKRIKSPRLVFAFALFLLMHALLMIIGLTWIWGNDLGVITWADYIDPFLPGIIVKSAIGAGLSEAYFYIQRRTAKND